MSNPDSMEGSTRRRRSPHRRARAGAPLLVAAAALLSASPAAAQQRADYMLDFTPEGTRLHVDFFGSGGIFRVEHVKRVYGSTNDVNLSASIAPTYPLGEAAVQADLRILFLGIGGAAGYRTVWRNMVFEPGEVSYCKECERGDRREVDELLGDTPGTDHWGWAEAHARLYMPFNEHFVGLSSGALRHEGRQDRSFDWFNSAIYDGGILWKWETMFFLKHRDWGGIGPYLQLLVLPRAGQHVEHWAYGFNAVRRLGLLRRDDLIFITVLAKPGDAHFGQHSYYAPVRGLINYRMTFDL